MGRVAGGETEDGRWEAPPTTSPAAQMQAWLQPRRLCSPLPPDGRVGVLAQWGRGCLTLDFSVTDVLGGVEILCPLVKSSQLHQPRLTKCGQPPGSPSAPFLSPTPPTALEVAQGEVGGRVQRLGLGV